MVTWIVVAVVVVAVLILALVVGAVLGRLRRLDRSVRRLGLRQQEALRLQSGAATLEATVADLQQRAELTQDRLTVIRAARGTRDAAAG